MIYYTRTTRPSTVIRDVDLKLCIVLELYYLYLLLFELINVIGQISPEGLHNRCLISLKCGVISIVLLPPTELESVLSSYLLRLPRLAMTLYRQSM
jgi:hypothetical protein